MKAKLSHIRQVGSQLKPVLLLLVYDGKLTLHVNASLTTVSLAKAGTVLTENQDKSSFSMADVKVVFSNKILTEYIFSKLALDLSCKKTSRLYLECLDIGRLVA